jgi:hypothetical protein
MGVLDYRSPVPRRPFGWLPRHLKKYLIVFIVLALPHFLFSLVILSNADEVSGRYRSSFWIPVGPDGGLIPTEFVRVYEFPMALMLYDQDGTHGGNGGLELESVLFFALNALFWSACLLVVWWAARLLNEFGKRYVRSLLRDSAGQSSCTSPEPNDRSRALNYRGALADTPTHHSLMKTLDYKTPERRRKSYAWIAYVLGVALIGPCHLKCSESMPIEPPPAQSSLFWTAVGPDGGHELSEIANIFEFPMMYLVGLSGQPMLASPHFAAFATINAIIWGLGAGAILHLLAHMGRLENAALGNFVADAGELPPLPPESAD